MAASSAASRARPRSSECWKRARSGCGPSRGCECTVTAVVVSLVARWHYCTVSDTGWFRQPFRVVGAGWSRGVSGSARRLSRSSGARARGPGRLAVAGASLGLPRGRDLSLADPPEARVCGPGWLVVAWVSLKPPPGQGLRHSDPFRADAGLRIEVPARPLAGRSPCL